MVDLRTIDLYSYLDLSVFSKVGYLDQLYVIYLSQKVLSHSSFCLLSGLSSTLTLVLTMSSVDGPYQVHCT
jgi:hypothetical protein